MNWYLQILSTVLLCLWEILTHNRYSVNTFWKKVGEKMGFVVKLISNLIMPLSFKSYKTLNPHIQFIVDQMYNYFSFKSNVYKSLRICLAHSRHIHRMNLHSFTFGVEKNKGDVSLFDRFLQNYTIHLSWTWINVDWEARKW